MAVANINPVYSLVANIGFIQTITTAQTAKDGTTGTLLFTADSTNGSKVDKIVVRALGTNTTTVLRIFYNNGSAIGTASNNSLIKEQAIAATTLSEVAALADNDILLGIVLPPSGRLYVSLGTTVAAGLSVTCYGGNI